MDSIMRGHESLSLPYRFESPHPPLPEPGRLMRLFGPVILILIGAVYRLGDEFTVSDPITSLDKWGTDHGLEIVVCPLFLWVPTRPRAGITGIDLRQGRYKRDFEIINDARPPSSGMRPGGCESISCQYPIYIAYTYSETNPRQFSILQILPAYSPANQPLKIHQP